MIFKTPIHNTNWVTKKAGLDQCGDETTWGFGGYGEPGSGHLSRILGKPGITKGGQTVVICDVDRLRPRAYIHRHKKHEKPRGWTKQGPFEVKCILEDVKNTVHGVDGDDNDGDDLWDELPHFTWDNFFSGDQIFDYMGTLGFGALMTCQRDRLPSGVPADNMCKKKTSNEARPKGEWFNQPINLVKIASKDGATNNTKCYERVDKTFQSTSLCNIFAVNVLDECVMYV